MAKLFKMEVLQGMELARRFRERGKTAKTETEKNVLKAGHIVGGRGRQKVHVLTGRCKASISTRLVPGMVTKPTSETGPQVIYGAALEAMYPYMKPALEDSITDIQDLFKGVVIKVIRG